MSDSDIDWEEFDEAKILQKIHGYKTALTKGAVAITDLCQRNTKKPSARTVDAIDYEYKAYCKRSDIVGSAYSHLMTIAKTDKDREKYEKGFNDNNNLKSGIRILALDAMEVENPAAPPAAAPYVPGHPADFKKTNEGLKPTTLSHEDTPEQLRSWERMWSSFYVTGNLKNLRNKDQQAWLLSVVDKYLAGRLVSRMKATTPIFEDPQDKAASSCLEIINDEFLRRYPIAARRHQFFSYSPSKGTPMCQVDDQLSSMCKNTDIAKMSEEEHLALRIVIACPDEGLKREFLKLRFMSLQNVRNTYDAWDQQLNTMSAIQPSTSYAQAAQAAPPRQQQQRNQRRGSNVNKPAQKVPTPNQDKLRQKLAGVCLRCSARDHATSGCPHRASLTCSSCGKSGHLQSVCFASARAADVSANTRRSVRSHDRGQIRPAPRGPG